MLCIKKVIAAHRLMCQMIGAAIGILLGFLASGFLVRKCSCGCGNTLKKKAKKAFQTIEDKLSL